jgi:predicted Ser/Thr protein kinase
MGPRERTPDLPTVRADRPTIGPVTMSEPQVTEPEGFAGPDTLAEFEPDDAPTEHEWLDREARGELERLYQLLALAEPTPTHVSRYRIERVLGRGGMGVVHLAWDPELDRHVALKLVHSGPFVDGERLAARLHREAKVLAQLKHPNVVKVFDVGRHEGELFVAMEYIAGPTLRTWQRAGTRSREQLVAAYVEAGRGLAAVHRAGIVHRDFKPDNVFVDRDGRVVVGDFGLADDRELVGHASASDDPRAPLDITRTGALLGTLRYMACERLRGEPASQASDQFEFCAALWEALTGVLPFAGETREALLEAMQAGPRGGDALERRVRNVLERGLAREPSRRFASLDELLELLQPAGPRWRAMTTLGLAATLGLVLGSVVLDRLRPPEPTPAACALAERFDALERDTLALPAATSASARAAVEAELARAEQLLRAEVVGVCEAPGSKDAPRVERWVALLEDIVELADEQAVTRTLDNLAAFAFERERMPPQLPSPELTEQLDLARDALIIGELDQARRSIDAAQPLALTRADQAELALRSGQLAQRSGQPALALERFEAGLRHAEVARLDHDRLTLHMLAADVALRAIRDAERAAHHHQRAADLLERLELPANSASRIEQRQHDALVAALVDHDHDRALSIQAEVVAQREAEGNPQLLVAAVLEHAVLLQHRMASEAKKPDDAALALADHRRVLAELDRLDVGPRDPLRLRAHYDIALLLWDANDPTHADEIAGHVEAVLAAGHTSLLLPTLQLASAVAIERWQADPSAAHRASLVEHADALRLLVAEPDLAPIERIDAWTYLALLHAELDDATALAAADTQVLALVAAAREQGVMTPFAADHHLAAHALQLHFSLADHPELASAFLQRSRALLERLAREHPGHPEVVALVDNLPQPTTPTTTSPAENF